MTETQAAQPEILLVDDDDAFRSVYVKLLKTRGFVVRQADDRNTAKAAFHTHRPAVVLLDLMLPPDGTAEGGIEQLRSFLGKCPETKIVVVSGAGDTRSMLAAVKEGAYDFISKPADPDVLFTVVERALKRHRLEKELSNLQASLAQKKPSQAIVGQSPGFESVLDIASRVAPTDLPILILGENGTGKELVARFIHEKSQRKDQTFLTINCGAVPEHLYESVLFGHKRGSFTGAVKDHAGLFAEANGGTLFLDEVGDLPLPQQVKLLRALELGEILPVGAEAPISVDVRILSATNRDLNALQQSDEFREDLYWRIKGTELVLPPLRDRPSDIPLLAAFFLNQAAALAAGTRVKRLSPAAEKAMLGHRWPGNLRELRHEMQRATVLMGDRIDIEVSDLSFATQASATNATPADASLQEKVEHLERQEIAKALSELHGNRSHTAERLGLSRQGLLKKMQRYGLV